MNFNRLLIIAILAPSAFVVVVVLLSYFPHGAGLLSHRGEHVGLSISMVAGIVPFSLLMLHIFRRIQHHSVMLNEELAQHNREMGALLKVGRAVEESVETAKVLPAALEAVLEATRTEAAEVWLTKPQQGAVVLAYRCGPAAHDFAGVNRFPLGEGYPGIVAQKGSPILVHDLPRDERFLRRRVKTSGFQTVYALPLRRTGGIIGVLVLAARDPKALSSDDELRLVQLMAEHIATAIENARLHEEVQTLAILTERERLAREMHDGLGQVLGYVNTKAQAVKELLKVGDVEVAVAQMEQLEAAARETYDDVRQGILALGADGRKRPLLDSLKEYVARFAEISELPTEFVVEGDPQSFNPTVEVQLLRIVQEALANARKHAHATKARVMVSFQPGSCRLFVEDDGQGFDPANLARGPWPHLGLQSIRERASAVGARLTLDTAPGRGTRVILDLPKVTA